jgi:hypothetical protein
MKVEEYWLGEFKSSKISSVLVSGTIIIELPVELKKLQPGQETNMRFGVRYNGIIRPKVEPQYAVLKRSEQGNIEVMKLKIKGFDVKYELKELNDDIIQGHYIIDEKLYKSEGDFTLKRNSEDEITKVGCSLM